MNTYRFTFFIDDPATTYTHDFTARTLESATWKWKLFFIYYTLHPATLVKVSLLH